MNIHTGKGMFTSTNPQLRRVSPENKGDRVCVKVVYVVLEAQYQSALSNAVKNINSKNDKVGVGAQGHTHTHTHTHTHFTLHMP
jgi:magnesium chelatase subunit H